MKPMKLFNYIIIYFRLLITFHGNFDEQINLYYEGGFYIFKFKLIFMTRYIIRELYIIFTYCMVMGTI